MTAGFFAEEVKEMGSDNPEFERKSSQWLLPFLLCLLVIVVGLGRIEDRAMIALPALTSSAMAAIGVPDEAEEETGEGNFEEVVPVSNASQLPRNRTRRILRDRAIASRGALSGAPNSAAAAVQDILAPGSNDPASDALIDGFALTEAAIAALPGVPGLLPVANRVFSGDVPGTAGGGTGTGTPGGGDAGGGNAPPGDGALVTAVPEPVSWLMMLMGFAFIASSLRRRKTVVQITQSRDVAPRFLRRV